MSFGEEWTRQEKSGDERDDRKCAQSTYLSTVDTSEEYYADVQTIIEMNGIDRMLEGKWWRRRVDGGCVVLFFATKAFRCLGVAGGYEEDGVSLNVSEAQWQVRKGCGR